MAQEGILTAEEVTDGKITESDALIVCRRCGKLVPRTVMCLYCGKPILYKRIRKS